MRILKVTAWVVFGLAAVIVVGGYLFLRSFDLNKYKPYVYNLVEKETGRKLAVNGDAELGISLIPTVVLNDVAFANPAWAKNPNMLTAKQIEVKFALLPLLKKQIEIEKIALISPSVNLEKAKDGAASWDFKPLSEDTVKQAIAQTPRADKVETEIKPEKNPEMALLAGFAARDVLIENGQVSYDDAQGGQKINLGINQITLSVPSFKDNVSGSFNVVYDGQAYKGEFTAGSVEQAMKDKEPFPLNLTATAMGINIKLDGNASDLTGANPRYTFKTNIYNPAGNLKAPETTLVADVDGDLNEVAAKISTLNIVNNNITGTVKVNWSKKVPYVDAVLQSPALNLQNFSQSSNFALELPSLIGEAQALTMVPDTTIPYGFLNQVNGKADLKVGQLIVGPGMQASNVLVKANLNGGILTVNPLQLQFGGGDIDAYLTVNAAAKNVQLKATSKNMLLQNLHKEFQVTGSSDFGVLSGGKLDLDINVSGNGATYRQLVNNLKGTAIAIVDKSVLQTGNLKFLTGNFVTQLMAGIGIDTSKTGKLDLTCAVVRADLGQGDAVFPKGIAVDSKQLKLVSDGKINLLNDKIDFTVKPFSGKVVDTNVVQAISSLLKVKGTLENPKLAIDDKEALKTVIGIAATGGTAYLGSKLALDADSSPCYTALQGTAYANRFPKPAGVQAAGQDVYKGVTQGVDDSVKMLKDTAKDILGIFKTPKK